MTETRISSTELARSIGEILGRLRYGGESFIVEKNGEPVAVLRPYPGLDRPPSRASEDRPAQATSSLADVLRAWAEGDPDPAWADLLKELGRADAPVDDPWSEKG